MKAPNQKYWVKFMITSGLNITAFVPNVLMLTGLNASFFPWQVASKRFGCAVAELLGHKDCRRR